MDEEPIQGGDEGEVPEDDQPNHWLIVGLRIAVVGLVVILGIMFVGNYLVDRLGLKDTQTGTSVNGPVPVTPIPQPSPSATPTPDDTETYDASDLPTLTTPPAPTDIPSSDPVPPGLHMSIDPTSVRAGEPFTVSGTYAGRDGVQVQLQRLESGVWADYPNDITVTMGTYATTATSTSTGTNSYRIYDQSTGRASNVVSIFVR